METDNSTSNETSLMVQKLVDLELSIQELRALIDQKFNQFENDLERLELRINNLR